MSRILDFSDGFTSAIAPTIGTTPASSVAVTPSGNLTSTDGQSALVQLQGEIDTINAQKGANSGLASLDSAGHVPTSQLPAAALGALRYKGALDASGGVYPSSPAQGDYYVINVAGTISGHAYKIGDWATYDGTTWDYIDNGQSVVSVAGRTGVIVLTKSDVGLGNVDNTSDTTKNSATATLTNKTISGASNTITNVSLTTGVTGTLPIANGGTNNASLAVTAGGVLYTDGTKVVNVGAGSAGTFLKSNGASAPTWAASGTNGYNCRYNISGSITAGPTAPINFATQSFDANSMVTTGVSWKCTVPVAGKWLIALAIQGSGIVNYLVYKNGSQQDIITTSDSSNFWGFGTDIYSLAANDYIDIRPDSSVTISNIQRCHVAITLVGT